MSASYLADCTQDVLDAAEQAIDPARTSHALPERIFVAHAEPVVIKGCEQLTVHLHQPRSVYNRAKPASPRVPERCQVLLIATATLQLWRCWPEGADERLPTAAEYSAAASALEVDLWCLLTYMHNAAFSGDLIDGLDCKSVTVGDALALRPQGGMAGWQLPVDFALVEGGPADAS